MLESNTKASPMRRITEQLGLASLRGKKEKKPITLFPSVNHGRYSVGIAVLLGNRVY